MRITFGTTTFDLIENGDGGWDLDELAVADDGQRVRIVTRVTALAPYDLCRRLGLSLDELVEALQTRPLTRVEIGAGGVGLGLVVQLQGGVRAMLKPRQLSPHSSPEHECAAYRIARALELPNVPPTVLREVSRDELLEHIPTGLEFFVPRLRAEAVFDGAGRTVASVMAWAEGCTPVDVNSLAMVRQRASWLGHDGPLPDGRRSLAAEYSSAIVLDVLLNNSDRWVRGNVLGSPDGLSTVWIDHGFTFGHGPTRARTLTHLRRCHRFSRRVVEAVRGLDRAALERNLASDLPLLDEIELGAVLARRDEVLRYIDDLANKHGTDAVFAFT
ncbi:hypothetical protein BH11MYX2_BH11MYX2_20690 [soil metagenome]